MKKLILAVLVACNGPSCLAAGPPSALPRSSPEAQGVSSAAVLEFVEAADRDVDALHSFMLVRHGHVVAEGWWSPYDAESPHELYSLSKSFTSTAVGLAVAEGKLSVDDEVLKFFPDDAPADPARNLKAMRVRDLLRMATGHQAEPSLREAKNWARAFLAQPVPHKPGTHFLYNTAATYMLSAIVQKSTGETVLDYLRPRLFEPLGIEGHTWGTSPQGVTLGGYGLSVRTEDIAKFGQLYLQKGEWRGKQLVPASWVKAATSLQTSNGSNPASDWDQGYGYQFWRARHGAYRGDGAFGQFCVVLPEQDAVVAITSGVRNMQAVLDLVWSRLLPAIKPEPLPAADDARRALERRLAGLALRPQDGSGSNGTAERVAGKTYRFPTNDRKLEAVTLKADAQGDATTLVLRFDGADQRVDFGRGAWRKGRLAYAGFPERAAAASGAWTGDDTFTARVCFYETPFLVTLRLKFSDDTLRFDTESNVGFGPTRPPQLVGSSSASPRGQDRPGRPAPEAPAQPAAAGHDFARWEKEIAAYEAADRTSPPPKGGALFIGSSTIRRWESLAQDFPEYKVINRGFGGSEIVDATHFADRLIFPHEPKQIFLRAGGNDIHAGRLPGQVAYDFADFVRTIRERLPNAEIIYIGVNPAPARWGESDKCRALNESIRKMALDMPRVSYVDAYDVSLGTGGRARPELFVADRLHFNAEGYKLLAECVRPYLTATR
jgi:CubicO group peptidase (beta-lactamase class C family)/lysophospholipase L1-like esterase